MKNTYIAIICLQHPRRVQINMTAALKNNKHLELNLYYKVIQLLIHIKNRLSNQSEAESLVWSWKINEII